MNPELSQFHPELEDHPESETKKQPLELKTSKGSVYTYLPDGRVQRFKTATGELDDPSDILVFIPSFERIGVATIQKFPDAFVGIENSLQFTQKILEYINFPEKTIWITDENGNVLLQNEDLTGKEVRIAFVDKAAHKADFYIKADIDPEIGSSTFDFRQWIDDQGRTMRARHIGNEVTEITYKK